METKFIYYSYFRKLARKLTIRLKENQFVVDSLCQRSEEEEN